ncbi:Protein N-acetyltransferase, RimJ/RimL family [Halogranum gelatinilyticum]|uniref:Protein N-acetyltransferase, RimJ/RimL family n=1 Tax=Halogranum gelatinilyticum TaxID=660521 RepID=A0A1G9RJ37_9EURY|nr:GNAT family protein [Halogranum gelatinilyticum]SDM22907.1 Protein N-acetyltransferase, RimJ/RimL family [Halogranum gelatinilyticum]
MPGPVFLRNETVELRTVESDDLAFVQEHINDPEVWGTLGSAAPKNHKDEEQWLDSLTDDDGRVVLLICDDGEPVGQMGLHLNETWGVGELGYWVAPDAWGNGYCTAAVRLISRYAFEERRLHKVVAEAYGHNVGSQRVLEKAGFTQEGVHREEAFVGGAYRDLLHYGLLEDEL